MKSKNHENNLQKAISGRRSHRQFQNVKIAPEDMQDILDSGLLAPSGKNRQPWKFIACGPHTKSQIVVILKQKIEHMTRESKNFGSLPISMRAIDECSELIMVYNEFGTSGTSYHKYMWKADIQSIGACIQNMLLTAHDKNIQTLWICDVLYAEKEIGELLGTTHELVAAVAFGIGTQKDIPKRPRADLSNKLVHTV